MVRFNPLLAILPLILAAAPLAAQSNDTPKSQFGGLVEVSEVLLDVLVTDKDGHVVLGLGPEDFVVTEDGKPVDLTGVSFYSNRFLVRDEESRRVRHPDTHEVLADRYFILFFQDVRRLGVEARQLIQQQMKASRDSREWVEKEMLPGDWVAVTSYDVKLKVHQDFTQDRKAILRAIEQAAQGTDPGNQWPSRRPDEASTQPTLLARLPQGDALRDQTTNEYEALRLLAEATHDVVGRKNLILIGHGFGEIREVATRSIEDLIAQPDPRYYPALEKALNANNVAVYPLDLTPNETLHAQSHFLNELAADSGGKYYENFVSFKTPLEQIADENNGYYLLSFATEHAAGEVGYRDVDVKLKNRELRVRARQGYRFGVTQGS